MKTANQRWLHVATTAAISILISASAAGDWGGWHQQEEACYKTTDTMRVACAADALDDLYVDYANCINSDDVRDCKREARGDFAEAKGECREQAEARDDLCDRLPDAGPYVTDLDPADFNGGCPAGNAWFPMIPGMVTTYVNETEDEEETIVVQVLDETREIEGIEAIIVRDTVYEGLPDMDGEPTGDRIEDTDDYYAVANNCDVWYLGEVAQNFEDGYLDNLDGSFIAGIDDAQAGIIMLAVPFVGAVYRQEFALGDAEDAAEVLSLAADIFDEEGELVEFDDPAFNCDGMCLKTDDFVGNEADSSEHKFYKAGIGVVAEQDPDGEVVLKIIKQEFIP